MNRAGILMEEVSLGIPNSTDILTSLVPSVLPIVSERGCIVELGGGDENFSTWGASRCLCSPFGGEEHLG